MNIQFRHRCLSMMLVLVMLFTMNPVTVIAEEEHDHSHDEAVTVLEVADLSVSASASADHVYVGDGAVTVTAKITGGMAPYEVTLQAVKNGEVAATDTVTTSEVSAKLSFAPKSYGDYELVVVVHDALHTQVLASRTLAVAEHDEESEADWAASVSGASLSSNWGRSLLSVAKTQVGYTESEKDFILKSGAKQGYSRYGAWYGTPYGGWNNAFLAFVAEYANIPNDAFLSGSSYRSWVNGMSAKGAYEAANSDYAPKAGDVAFLSGSRVAIVESVSGSNVSVIEGDVNGAVVRKTYALSKVVGFGNTGLLMGLSNGGATPVPTKAPEVTKAPEGSATATPAPTAKPTATVVPEEEELTFQATPTPGPGVTVAPKDDENPLGSLIAQVGDTVEQMQAAATSVPTQFSEAYYLMKDEMTKLVEKYLGTATPTEAEVKAFVDGLGLQEVYYIISEMTEIQDFIDSIGISEYELDALLESEYEFSVFSQEVNEAWGEMTQQRKEGSFTLLNGLVTVSWNTTDSNSTTFVSKSDDQNATYGVRGASIFNGGAQTLNVTFTNNASYKAKLSFTMASTNLASKSGDAFPVSSGLIELTLEAGASVSGLLKSNSGFLSVDDTTGSFTNFALTEIIPNPKVTIDYDATQGTVSVDGTTVGAGTVKEVATGGSITLAATVNSGTFYAWVDGDGKILSTSASFTLSPTNNMTVKPFILKADSNPYFMVANQYLFDNLMEADAKAATLGSSASTAVIVPLRDGTLPAADYTISKYVTLLIPYNASNSLHTSTPSYANAWENPSVYRTLTMSNGANITVNGAISVGGRQSASGGHNGHPYGALGFIRMNEGSKITLNSGAALYAWGFIIGDGEIDALSGSKVYEDFQLEDWRGGSATTGMLGNDQRVFPMSQYYVQNIEVPLKLYAGASEYGFMSVYAAYQLTGSEVPFIGPSGLFRNSSGYVIKDYDESEDRLLIKISGSASIASLNITMSMVGTVTSQDYVLPLNSSITIDVLGGSNISLAQDLALHPGSRFYVREGARINLNSGNNIFVYDIDDWKAAYIYQGQLGNYAKVSYAPGRIATANRNVDAFIQIDGTINATDSYAYTTKGQANIYSTGAGKVSVLVGGQANTYQAVQADTNISYEEVAITPAYLKNADGSYTPIDGSTMYIQNGDEYIELGAQATGKVVNYAYNKDAGMWIMECDASLDTHYFVKQIVAPTCDTQGYDLYVCQCGANSVQQNITDPLGHHYDVAGYETDATEYCLDRTCTACGTVKVGTGLHTTGLAYTCVDTECTICHTNVPGDGIHAYTAKVETVPPTCVTDGYTRSTCACGAYVDSEIVKAAHTYAVTETVNAVQDAAGKWSWSWTGAADAVDCTAAGSVTYTCSVCEDGTEGKTYTETIAAPGHDDDSGVNTDPTCYEQGYTTYTCQRCGREENRNFVPTTEHNYGEETVVEATCISGGYTYKVCQVEQCQYKYIYNETEATGNHIYQGTPDANVKPDGNGGYVTKTCTVDGIVTYTCTTPGCTDSYTENIKAPGHTEVTLAAVAATCLAPGKTEGKQCSVCEEITVPQTEIAQLDHNYVTDETASKAPTCTEAGLTVTVCTNGCTYRVEKVEPALDHDFTVEVSRTESSCSVAGKVVNKCVRCNETEETKLALAAHNYGENGYTSKEAPTCSTPGYIHYDCQYADCTEAPRTEVDPEYPTKVDHNQLGEYKGEPATCTTAGLTDGAKCSWCGKVTLEREVIDARGHSVTEWTETAKATCLSEGEKQGVCATCGETVTETIAKVVHAEDYQYTEFPLTPATCQADGYMAYTYCDECAIEITKKITLPKGTGEGFCSYVKVDGTPATCTEPGLTDGYRCEWCGTWQAGKEQQVIPAIHDTIDGITEAIPATCITPGHDVGSKKCNVCNIWFDDKVLEATGVHAYTIVIESKAATCEDDAYEIRQCSADTACTAQETFVEEGSALGHDYQVTATSGVKLEGDKYVLINCKVAGSVTYTCANDESHTYTDTENYKALDDHSGEWTVKQAATCQAAGEKERTCTVCGEYETAVIDKLVHTEADAYTEVAEKTPTCTEAGHSAYTKCNICNLEIGKVTEGYEIDKVNGHDYQTVPGKEADCYNDGLTDGEQCTICLEWKTPQTVIKAGHPDDQITTLAEAIPSTHNTQGYPKGSRKCEKCGEWLTTGRLPLVTECSWVQTDHQDATCYAEGYTAYQCKWYDECGQTKTDTHQKTSHSYDAGVGAGMALVDGVWVREDCLTAGTVTYTCTNDGCTAAAEGHSYTDTYDALASHSGEWNTTLAATCQTEGAKDRTCDLCDAHESAVIEKLVHTEENAYTEYEEKKATCVAPGYSAYKHCNICDLDIGKVDYEIDPDGHDYQPVDGKDAGCETTGLEKAMQCVYCGKWQDLEGNDIDAQPVIPTIHSGIEGIAEAIPVTCYQDGHSAGSKYCPDCETWFEGETTEMVECDVQVKAHVDATCTADGYTIKQCVYYTGNADECDNTETITIPAYKHEWEREGAVENWVETKAPSCYETGVLTWTCECGESTTDEIPMIAHTYNNGVPGKETTKWNETIQQWENCVETDTIVYTCQNVGCTAENSETHTYTVDLAVIDHAWVYDAQDEPTCTEPGTASGKHCTRCGLEEGGGEIPAKGHTWDAGVGTGAKWDEEAQKWVTTSCTENGSVLYTCTLCTVGEYTKTETVTAPGHAWDEGTVAVEATCVNMGSTTYKCDTCGEKETREDIPATGIHDQETLVPGYAATCTETGLTDGYNCSMCGAEQVKQNVIPAIHDTIEGIAEAIPATCITAGHDVGSKYCGECGKWFDDKVLEATGVHSYTNVIETVEATCEADGYIIKQCTADAACTAQETFANGSATGHAWIVSETEGVVADGEGWKLLNCEVAGTVTYVCGNDASHIDTKTIEATGHQHTEVIPGKAVTCLEDGYEDGLKCTDCGTVITERKLIPAKGEHTWGAWVTTTEAKCGIEGEERRDCEACDAFETNKLDALTHDYDWEGGKVVTEMTCLVDGKITYICQLCGEAWVDPASIQKAPGSHDPSIVAAVPAKCGIPGSTEGQKCDRCGEWTVEPTEIPALEHVYDEGVILEGDEPTCEGTGLKTFTCTRDSKLCDATIEGHIKTEVVPAAGHDIVIDEAVESTCTATGLTEGQHCTKCDAKTIAQTVVAKKPHTEEEIPAVEVTCEVDGYSAGLKCSVCGTVLVEPELTEKAHHLDLHQVAAQAPECEKIGWDAYEYCGKCDYTTYVEKAALEHNKVTVEGYDETCDKDGLTDGVQCTLCEKWFTEQQPIPAGHKAVDVEAVPVTCLADGCTAGKKCSVCGEILEGCEVIKTEGHKEETLEAKAPTCTADGLTEGKQCTVCGEITVAQEPVTKLGHKYTDLPAVDPTCTADGLTKGSWCDRCGTIWLAQEIIKTTGHNIVIDKAVEATCTSVGLTEGQHCTKCDEMTVAQEPIPMKAHTEEEIPAVPVTCLVDGKTAGKKCSVCGTVTVEPEVIKSEGHKEKTLEAKAPTCTADGLTEGKQCTVCGIITVPQNTDPATGHTEEILPAVDATCTEAGKTEGLKCSVCQTVLKKQETINAKGHDDQKVAGYAATCTEDGLSDGMQCSVCGTWTLEQKVITALGHKEKTLEAQAPTCVEDGLTEGKQCTVCGVITVPQETDPATDHTVVIDEAVAATCTKAGLTEGKHCSVCGEILLAQIPVDATGHTEESLPAVAPTCTEPGKTAGVKCSVCDAVIEAQKTINATNHANKAPGEAKDATCTENGNTAGVYCPDCDTWLEKQETIPAINHANKAPGEAKDATCTADGNTAGEYCPDCDTWLVPQEIIPAANHANKAPGEAKDATCTEAGNTAGIYCPDCDTWLEEQESIPATGHDMDEGFETTLHTCTTAGVLTYTCLNGCGYTETEEVPAAHTPVVIEAVAPTCTTDGASEGSKCSVCDEVLVEPTVVPAAHTWEDVEIFVAATCTTDGSKSVRCTVEGCGATETVTIPATGHTEVIDPAKAATCEENGLTAGKHCSVCEEVLVAQKVIAGGHRWNKAPCTVAGTTCSRCGKTNEEMLEHDMAPATCTAPSTCKYGCGKTDGEALGHTIVEIEEIPAMCEEPGWTSGTMCSVCGVTIEAPKVIPALEHQIVQYAAKKPSFTSAGWAAYEACDFCAYSTKVEIPALGAQTISSYADFMEYLPWLEKWAVEFARVHPETDPVDLVIKYIRTGVDRYNSGSWGIMAGYENAEFAKYVGEQEDKYNQQYDDIADMLKVSGLKNLDNFKLPNGDLTDIGHMFGTMDITYNNDCGVNHADVGGWAGDLVDLLSTADHSDHADAIASANGDFEALVDVIRFQLLGKGFDHGDVFSQTDIYGDLDAFYVMKNLDFANYEEGDMTALFNSYFTLSLSDVDRAAYLLEHRLNGVATRSAVRDAVYTAYTSNNVISTLEGTRDFNASDLTILRQAVCYAFADYLCALAGDYVDVTENPYLTVFQSEHQQLAPGISMEIHMANSADDKQMVYYLAYASVGRDDVDILANYNERYVTHWEMSRVLDQANSTQELYGNPESEHYIENFNVVTAINGAGFNMHTGEPGGLLVMHGEQYHAIDGNGFFGMHEDGYAVIGTTDEYNTKYKGKITEAIAGFGTMLVKDGELAVTATSDYYSNRASRTAVGITRTGKVVFMVLDGRQEPWSCGGSMIEIAQIMKNAGCVQAINLDGGGSTTFVARRAGDEELSVVNRPSDGVARSVSTGLVMISTAPSSTAFDHAVVESDYTFATVNSTVQMTAKGVSATGNVVDLPEGAVWEVSDETVGTIDENGVFTAKALGSVEVRLMLGEATLGAKTLNVVVPDMLYFTREKIDGVYGAKIPLPLKARYQGKEVAFNVNDIAFMLSNDTVGTMEGLSFKAVEESTITNVVIVAMLASDEEVNASISVVLFKQGENSFDFDQATGGTRILAWSREVSNANTADNSVYYVANPEEDMVTTYTIALDMTQIPIPKRLDDLIYMLPGADMEGASAWTFLLQLAERISVLTTVTPKVQVDPNFDVDYSEIKLINDYFQLNSVELDEETNTLTMNLSWIDQTQPIPVETANPLCMVTGLKLTPKADAAWNDKDQLKPVNKGTVSYTIYMRASGLYSFAQKAENQEIFGLYPFVNPNDASEKGGYFHDTYANFEDSYTLVRSLKNGWYNEESGFRYYVNGVYHTGVQKADGLFYDFGANGINVGKKTYTGLHVMDGNTYYIQAGEIGKGWNIIGDDWYYFDTTTGIGLNGDHMVSGHVYPFKDGKVLHGVWVNDGVGLKYYYGPGNYYAGWRVIEGEEYFFEKNYAKTGITPVQESHDTYEYWYEFTETGKKVGFAPDGLHWFKGELYYIENGLADHEGLYYVDGNYYNFVTYSFYAVRAAKEGEFKTFWVYAPNDTGKPEGMYRFDHLGRMILTNEIVEESGVLYYYEDGTRANNKGLVLFEGNYYYIIGGGRAVQGEGAWVTNVNGLDVKTGYYRFDENGHMLMEDAIVLESDGLYHYYEDGRKVYTEGLVKVDGDYYYIQSNGTAITNTDKYVFKTNGLMAKGTYYFGPDGKMIQRLLGDADGDKEVDLDDAVMVFEYVAGEEVTIYLFNADVNGDGKIDANDALLIMQYDAGWDVKLK